MDSKVQSSHRSNGRGKGKGTKKKKSTKSSRVQDEEEGKIEHSNREAGLGTHLAADTINTLIGQEEDYIKQVKIKKNLSHNGTFNINGKIIQYSKKSLFFFVETNPIRIFCVRLIDWKWFDRFILACIIANSIVLGLFDYSDRDATQPYNQKLNLIGDLFTIAFILESFIKIIAMGFIFHKYSYLREGWNFIDFVIVCFGVVDLVASSVNLKSLRILRVLRPLKSINAISSMRLLVTTLLQSLPELFNATIFLIFIIILFGVLGVQTFNGVIYFRCRLTPEPVNATYWPKSIEFPRVCSPVGDGAFVCPLNLTCGSPVDYGISLEDDGVYQDGRIQFGISSFDNFGQSILAVFQIITKDGWSQLMYNRQLADGYTSAFGKIYCTCIIVLGSYFMLNLILAVIMQNFTRICQLELEAEVIQAEKEMHLNEINIVSGKQKPVSKSVDVSQRSHRSNKVSNRDSQGKDTNKNQNSARSSSQARKSIKIIKEVDEEKLNQKLKEEEEKEEKVQGPSNFQQMMNIKNKKEAVKAAEAESFELIANDIRAQKDPAFKRKATTESGKHMAKGFALAFMAKAMALNQHEIEEIDNVKDNLQRAQKELDIVQRLKMQAKLYNDQKDMLKKMDFEIKKRYALSKRNVYGLDNETMIIQQLKKRLLEILKEKQEKAQSKAIGIAPDDDEIEKEIDEQTEIALKISANLKESTMKQHIKELLFNKFKSQLIRKNMLEKLFIKVETQMIQSTLKLRGKKFFLYRGSYFIVKSYIFNGLMVLCIIGNAIVLALDQYPVDTNRKQYLDILNQSFFAAFALELILKLLAYGFKYYFKDKFNWFDGLVVILSGLDVGLSYVKNDQSSGAITALRIFRLIRLFQLAKVWKELQDLLTVITQTIKDISNISILLLLFIFTYSLLGMELFSYKLQFNQDNFLDFAQGQYPQSTFNTFLEAFFSVFIVLANDGWTTIYFNCYRATEPVSSTLYFVSLIIIGQYILLNLFIAILIENFEQISLHQDTVNRHNKTQGKTAWQKFWRKVCCKKDKNDHSAEEEDERMKKEKLIIDEQNKLAPSLYVFSKTNKFRVLVKKIVNSSRFEAIMFLLIIANCAQLAIDNPLNDPKTDISTILNILDIFLTTCFSIEAALKIIHVGFCFCGSTSYIRSGWNQLDFFVVILSIISLSITTKNLSSVKILRLLKVLRPLRVIARNEGLKISLLALVLAIPGIINIIIVTMLVYFIYGIIGMNYMKGKLYYCENSFLPDLFNLSGLRTKWDCVSMGGEWLNFFQNFDNIGRSMSTLYQISTTVMWQDLMYKAASSQGGDMMPRTLSTKGFTFFFVSFIVVANFFILNLFVGVVITTYNREKEILGKNFLLTEKQRKWLQNKILFIQSKPMIRMKQPREDWRAPFFYLAEYYWFDRFILICILGNTADFSIQYLGQPAVVDYVTSFINYVFAVIFTLEVVVKIVAYGWRYFKDGWNNFDVVIVLMTIISICLSLTTKYQIGTNTTIIRSFRIGRIFKLFRRNKSLKLIFQTFIAALPAMANIGSLLLLFIFIFSILGVYMFADVKLNGALNSDANFQNVGNAFLTLIRISTGEKWPLLMNELQQQYNLMNQCIYQPQYADYANNGYQTIGCGNYYFSIIYFYAYVLLIHLIYLKLFIAIILQGFQDTTEKDNKVLNSETSDHFRVVWSRFDPDATTFIRENNYQKLLLAVGEPMGWDKSYTYNYLKQQEYLSEVNLPKYNKQKDYQFMDVFEHLALLMIIKKEVKEYLERYQQKLTNVEKIQKMMTVLSDSKKSNQTQQILTNRSQIQTSQIQSLRQNESINSQRMDHLGVRPSHNQAEKSLKMKLKQPPNGFDDNTRVTPIQIERNYAIEEEDDLENLKLIKEILQNNSIAQSTQRKQPRDDLADFDDWIQDKNTIKK